MNNQEMSLVSTSWLNEKLASKDWSTKYILLDATWDLPVFKRDFVKEHFDCRIPGAVHFSLRDCCDRSAKLPNTIPPKAHFEQFVSSLGVSNDHHIVVYDNSEKYGLFSAPRAWWLFKVFGHDLVSVLNGGLPKWKKDGYKTSSGEILDSEKRVATTYKANYRPELFKDLTFMKQNHENKNFQVLDARSNERFRGVSPEPRPDIPSGHMPGSISVPFAGTLDSQSKTMLPDNSLRQYFDSKNVDLNKDMVTSCGSGITASALAFAIYRVTGKEVPIYDGSWFEWQTCTPNEPEWQLREKTDV